MLEGKIPADHYKQLFEMQKKIRNTKEKRAYGRTGSEKKKKNRKYLHKEKKCYPGHRRNISSSIVHERKERKP